MKYFQYFFISILIISTFSFTKSNYEKKKIDNKLYSFSVPADWECGIPEKVKDCDCSAPFERDVRIYTDYLYHLYYLQWRSPDKDSNISVVIQTYQRKDSVPVTIKEIEFIIRETNKQVDFIREIDKKDSIYKKNQKRIIIKKKDEILNVITGNKLVNSYQTYSLVESKGRVHCLCIYAEEKKYLLPEIQQIIKDILNSFTAK